MGKKRRERLVVEKKRKNRRMALVATGIVVAVSVILALVLFAGNDKGSSETISLAKNSDGSLTVPKSALGNGMTTIDYGYEQSILVMTDLYGIVRTAYNTCFDCFASGNALYSLIQSNTTLLCRSCGTTYPATILGTSSWGGCQPVSIPPDYRNDTAEEIVFPSQLLAYAEDMFAQWKNFDYTLSLEGYLP